MPRPAVSPLDQALAQRLREALDDYAATVRPLPGIASPAAKDTFIAQLVDSDRRRRFALRVGASDPHPKVLGEPVSAFNPHYAAVRCVRDGDFDEACWLVFLATHFGFHRHNRWALSANFYRRLDAGQPWTWETVSAEPAAVRAWLDSNRAALRSTGGPFGNHRKYESLAGNTPAGTGETIESYVEWVGPSHRAHFDDLCASGSAQESFAAAYTSMAEVARFGRTARFDYLTMLGKLGIVDLCPDKLCLQNSTGPLNAARLLVSGSAGVKTSAAELEGYLCDLGDHLGVTFDILEDGLCNWQKSPGRFISFRG
ncbi:MULTISPECIES: hypothetical protein [Mycobacterium]|uniref:alpha-glutamyl/putrescinyl thymine pyrophosphorylase clade 3 protein n=1 Tax=Mycobacterium TaxID=1763 RepID=UPI000965A615|nr:MULTISPECIES: hypothetical protein [Mycobacterium]MCG7606811.1 hypothetical protein [Mycobacterium sp. CnD-18-1]OLT98199.1 hypothetical protein BKG60_01815 [Mycobacterium syngnathidarum]